MTVGSWRCAWSCRARAATRRRTRSPTPPARPRRASGAALGLELSLGPGERLERHDRVADAELDRGVGLSGISAESFVHGLPLTNAVTLPLAVPT